MSRAGDNQQDQAKKHEGLLVEKKSGINTGMVLRVAAVVILIAAVPISYFLFLSPRAQVKRAFSGAVNAFERMDSTAVLDTISDNYIDDMGNTKDVIASVLPEFFVHFKSAFAHIAELDIVFIEPELAEVTATGQFILTRRDDTHLRLKTEEPVVVRLKKEAGGWKITAIVDPGQDFSNLPQMSF